MYKDKYKDHYIAVLQALQDAREGTWHNDTIRLYLNSNNKLDTIPYPEIRDILTSMMQEDLIKIVGFPRMSVLLYDDKPITEPLPELFQSFLPKRTTENYYQLVINPGKFGLVYNYYCLPRFVLRAIPSTPQDKKKYKVLEKIIMLLVGSKSVDSYIVAASFNKVRDSRSGKSKPLTLDDYKAKKKHYDELIENRLKTLRMRLKELGYTVKFKNNTLQLAEI